MHRRPLLDLIKRHARRFPDEAGQAEHFAQFVAAHPDCFERSCAPGHVTGSAWLTNHDGSDFLLTLHRKLGRWLQLGGHADGDPDPARVALREASEESGIEALALALCEGLALPLDLDAHAIPARPGEPAHIHYDVRFLVIAPPDARLTLSEESLALRWFAAGQPLEVPHDPSVARLRAKAEARRAR